MSRAKKLFALITVVFSCTLGSAQAEPPKREHVETVKTPLTQLELLQALRDGHLKVFGSYPSKNRLAMAWGQVAFENAAGRASYNHNLGNVGPTSVDQPTYFNKGDKHWYRAFYAFDDAAAAYWRVIKRCQPALVRFDLGNPREAAAALKRCNYFEAELEEYAPGFSSLFYYAINHIIPEDEREQQRQTEELIAAIKRSINEGGPSATPAPDPPADIRDFDLGDGD